MELRKWSGFDPMEREMGVGTGLPCQKLAKAIIGSRAAANKIKRWRLAARAAPATPAVGGFPYNHRSVADVPKRRLTPPTFHQSDYGYGQ